MVRVVVLGHGTLGIKIAAWFKAKSGYDLVRVVPVLPEPRASESLSRWAEKHGVPVVESGSYEDIDELQIGAGMLDLAFLVGYDRILPPWFMSKCRRILNMHDSPLPAYRGIAPINWALKRGERRHGATIHEVTTVVDGGPVVSQVTFSVYPEIDEVVDVYQRYQHFAWVLFQETMPLIDRIAPMPQDDAKATHFGKKDLPHLGDRASLVRNEQVD